eukprot:jgi/Ulvmu1/1064/UM105_0023.1
MRSNRRRRSHGMRQAMMRIVYYLIQRLTAECTTHSGIRFHGAQFTHHQSRQYFPSVFPGLHRLEIGQSVSSVVLHLQRHVAAFMQCTRSARNTRPDQTSIIRRVWLLILSSLKHCSAGSVLPPTAAVTRSSIKLPLLSVHCLLNSLISTCNKCNVC